MDFERNSDNHRTTVGYFLNKGKWDSGSLESALKEFVVNIIYGESIKSEKPVFIIIDDTIASKTKPSS